MLGQCLQCLLSITRTWHHDTSISQKARVKKLERGRRMSWIWKMEKDLENSCWPSLPDVRGQSHLWSSRGWGQKGQDLCYPYY